MLVQCGDIKVGEDQHKEEVDQIERLLDHIPRQEFEHRLWTAPNVYSQIEEEYYQILWIGG
jgi:hypothetical protein